eukprot:366458-Chlamydomonas_euryale.AAC.11
MALRMPREGMALRVLASGCFDKRWPWGSWTWDARPRWVLPRSLMPLASARHTLQPAALSPSAPHALLPRSLMPRTPRTALATAPLPLALRRALLCADHVLGP